MKKRYPSFEDYLMERYAEKVRRTEDDTPNEEIWLDMYETWVCDLDVDDMIQYGNQYGIKMAEIAIHNLQDSIIN